MFTTTALISSCSKVINPTWLTGPIFDKEMRVSSRRLRNYVLRSAYLLLLVILVIVAWSTVRLRGSGNSTIWQVSRMAEVGRQLVLTITWLQFLAAQILAVVMLSNSISDEINRGTIDVLMTTPINSVQVVLGKLLSRLFQLILVLAVSLPLLAVIRVFGGIQWDYVISALSITFTATVFVGSLCMFLSIKIHRPYLVILIMMTLLVVAYTIRVLLFVFPNPGSILMSIMTHINPFAAMTYVTSAASPASRVTTTFFSLPLHCLAMGGASMFILFASAFRMRRRAIGSFLRTDGGKKLSIWKRIFIASVFKSKRYSAPTHSIRSVTGSPIIWKELARPFSESLRTNAIVFGILLLVLFVFFYLSYLFKLSSAGPSAVMIFYSTFTSGLWLIATVRTTAMAATSITKEKEARTLPILLGTLLEPWQIVRGKALTVLWRNTPAWLILALSRTVFYILMFILRRTTGDSGQAYLYYYIIIGPLGIAAYVVFLIGIGMYFSARLKSSTAAVMATIGSVLGLYVMQRFLFSLFIGILARGIVGNIQLIWILSSLLPILFHAVVGPILLRQAKCRLKLNIF